MKRFYTILIFFLLLVCGRGAAAQSFAVQASVQVMPPYSVYLSDYATPGVDKLRVILVQRDLSRPAYQLRLVMSVELNGRIIMRTARSYMPPPINLDPGIPTIISGADLAGYVDSRNLDFVGYSREQYEKTKALPEGSYRIIFTAYDYRRQDQQVSNEGSGFYFFSKNEPPLVNFPACGSVVPTRTFNGLSQPQQIVFSWLPRSTASPNSATSTEYEFSLYEVRPAGRNPNDVVLTTPPIYRARTNFTQLVYGITEPVLRDSMSYVWRVQAIDADGRDAFRNNGFSEACSFYYGGNNNSQLALGSIVGLQAEGETDRRARIWWEAGEFGAYRVHYKKKGAASEWFTADVKTPELKVFDLEPDTQYETRVQGKTAYGYGYYTDIVTFRTQPLQVNQCGDPAVTPGPLGNPLPFATAGMTITASDMDIILTDVQHTGVDGWYKGLGRVQVKYLGGASFTVRFDRLYIDENRQAKEGRIEVVSKGINAMIAEQLPPPPPVSTPGVPQNWSDVDFSDRVFEYDQIAIDNIITDASGNLVITDDTGATLVNTEVSAILLNAPEKAVIIEDKNGDQWVVQKDHGTGATKITKVEGGSLPGSNVVANADRVKTKILGLILGQFDEEIDAWLRINGKGGEDDMETELAAELPACFPKNADILVPIRENIIPRYQANLEELLAKVEATESHKALFDKLKNQFNATDQVDWTKLSAQDQADSRDAVCHALTDDLNDDDLDVNTITSLIDYDKLVKWLIDNKGQVVEYNFADFISHEVYQKITGKGLLHNIPVDKSFYAEIDNVRKEFSLKGTLSVSKGLVNLNPSAGKIRSAISINSAEDKINYKLLYDFTEKAGNAISLEANRNFEMEYLFLQQGIVYTDWYKERVIAEFKAKIASAATTTSGSVQYNCNELDYLYENIPGFVLESFSDNDKWAHLRSLSSCKIDDWGTNEYESVVSIINGLSAEFLTEKVDLHPNFFMQLYARFGNSEKTKFIVTVTGKLQEYWTGGEEPKTVIPEEVLLVKGVTELADVYVVSCFDGSNGLNFAYSACYKCSDGFFSKEPCYDLLARTSVNFNVDCKKGFIVKGSAPVMLRIGDNRSIAPAFIAGQIMIDRKNQGLHDILAFQNGGILINAVIRQATLNRWWKFFNVGKVDGADDIEKAIDEALAIFYSGDKDKILQEIVEESIIFQDYKKLSHIFGLDKSIIGTPVGATGTYRLAASNNFPGEELGAIAAYKNIKYFDLNQRKAFEVFVKDGQLIVGGKLLKETPGKIIFVLDGEGHIYASAQRIGEIHHSSFLSGADVATAGEFTFVGGRLQISPSSGHYTPTAESLKSVVKELTSRGVNLNEIDIVRNF
jgi:TANFOR domain-containing protein